MTYFIYNTNTVLRRHGKYNEQDPNIFYVKHFKNFRILSDLLRKSTDFIVRSQIRMEMDIASNKMNWWKNRSGFCPMETARILQG